MQGLHADDSRIWALPWPDLHVPVDVSLVGCDDLDLAAFTNPPLTTIRQPMEALVDCLLRAAVPTNTRLIQEEIIPQLVERNSTAAAHAHQGGGRG